MTTEHWFAGHLRDIPRAECLRLISGRTVGRIAFSDDSGPLVLPVNFAVDGETVLIAAPPTGRIATFATTGPVAFEVDEADEYTESGWSVLLRGVATVVPPEQVPAEGKGAPRPWAERGQTVVLRITPHEITGRRLLSA